MNKWEVLVKYSGRLLEPFPRLRGMEASYADPIFDLGPEHRLKQTQELLQETQKERDYWKNRCIELEADMGGGR